MKQKVYRYYLTQRGISPGCQPSGFINCKDTPNSRLTNGCRCYGYVEYDRELTDSEVIGYELLRHSRRIQLEGGRDND